MDKVLPCRLVARPQHTSTPNQSHRTAIAVYTAKLYMKCVYAVCGWDMEETAAATSAHRVTRAARPQYLCRAMQSLGGCIVVVAAILVLAQMSHVCLYENARRSSLNSKWQCVQAFGC